MLWNRDMLNITWIPMCTALACISYDMPCLCRSAAFIRVLGPGSATWNGREQDVCIRVYT
jgi:hypothetical protein